MDDDELRAIIGESEGQIQTRIVNYLESLDYMVLRQNSGKGRNNIKLAPKGTPDIQVIMFESKSMWIETKRPGEDLSDKQREVKANLESRGQYVIVARSVDDVIEGLKKARLQGENRRT